MITVSNVTKNYTGFRNPLDRIISSVTFGFFGGNISFRALDDISLTVGKGEILGIIGRNGAGKSTLLKLLSGVSKYQEGKIEVSGSIRSILELGVGFNPELSGEENVYYNGLIWGYSPREIGAIMKEVFSFASLTDFTRVPLKNYSSGMIMRLGFALATARRPDVLLVDEALAVGDASFQQKCLNRFEEFRKAGTATIIVSHDLNLLKVVSTRILVIERGKVLFDGEPSLALSNYMRVIAENSFGEASGNKPFLDNAFIEDFSVTMNYNGMQNPPVLPVASEIFLKIKAKAKKNIPDLTIGFHIDDSRGVRVFGSNSFHLGQEIKEVVTGSEVEATFRFPLNLSFGKYTLGISLHEGDNHSLNCYLWEDSVLNFELERVNVPKFDGIAYLPVSVNVSKK